MAREGGIELTGWPALIVAVLALAVYGLTFFVAAPAASEERFDGLEYVGSLSIPPELSRLFREANVSETHEIVFTQVNPFYLWGDFDGDGARDYAVVVGARTRTADYESDEIVLRGNGKVHWLEKDLGNNVPGPAWYVVPKDGRVLNRPDLNDGREPPELKSDAFIMARPYSSSALIYWDGSRFRLYWQSD